jgi:hypothetical protein
MQGRSGGGEGRIERVRKAARVDGALVRVEVMRDVNGTHRLLAITDARVRRPAAGLVRECAGEGTGEGRVDRGRFPNEEYPAVMLPAIIRVRMRYGRMYIFRSWGTGSSRRRRG